MSSDGQLSAVAAWLRRGVSAWAAATLLVGLSEWLVLLRLDGTATTGLGSTLALLLLAIGNLARFTLLAVIAVLLVERVRLLLLSRKMAPRRSVALIAGGVFLLALP